MRTDRLDGSEPDKTVGPGAYLQGLVLCQVVREAAVENCKDGACYEFSMICHENQSKLRLCIYQERDGTPFLRETYILARFCCRVSVKADVPYVLGGGVPQQILRMF